MSTSKILIKFTVAKLYYMSAASQQMLDYFNQLNNTEQETILQTLTKKSFYLL